MYGRDYIEFESLWAKFRSEAVNMVVCGILKEKVGPFERYAVFFVCKI